MIDMYIALGVLVLACFFFVDGRIRSDIIAISSLIILMATGILTTEEALSGFSNSIVVMMVGLFIVGGAIFRTGLAGIISGKILALAGTSQTKLFILVMLVTAGIGGFVSNTGTVALMLPIVVTMAMGANTNPSRYLMPMAFASSMGGMMTLIGTPPNLIINNALLSNGFEGLSFFSFLPVGLICVVLGIITLGPMSKRFLDKNESKKDNTGQGKSLKALAKEYQLANNLFRVRLTAKSPMHNQKLADLNLTNKYGLSILEIRRKSNSTNPFLKTKNYDQKIAGADTVLETGDVLYVMGPFALIRDMADENNLELIDVHETEETASTLENKLKFDRIGIAEVVLLSNSELVNQPVMNSGFREKYNVNILGIQRRKEYLLKDLKDIKMNAGDALLVQGEWSNIARLSDQTSEWVVVGQPTKEILNLTIDNKAPIAAVIMLGMIVCMVFNILPAVTAVLLAAVLMILSGCFHNVSEAYKTINWESIVLIGSMMPMSIALEKTGVSSLVSGGLVDSLGVMGPTALLAGIYFTTSLMTMFLSNTATAVLLAPIAISVAINMERSPYPFLFAVTVAASMCFASPFSTPPNALVMSAGRYTFMDYVKVGLPLQILFGIVMIILLPLLFPY